MSEHTWQTLIGAQWLGYFVFSAIWGVCAWRQARSHGRLRWPVPGRYLLVAVLFAFSLKSLHVMYTRFEVAMIGEIFGDFTASDWASFAAGMPLLIALAWGTARSHYQRIAD